MSSLEIKQETLNVYSSFQILGHLQFSSGVRLDVNFGQGENTLMSFCKR